MTSVSRVVVPLIVWLFGVSAVPLPTAIALVDETGPPPLAAWPTDRNAPSLSIPTGTLSGPALLDFAFRIEPDRPRWADHQRLVGFLRSSRERSISPAERPASVAQQVFQLVQQRTSPGEYTPDCAQLSQTLRRQAHNCLTATLLFVAGCREAGLPCFALGSAGHVCAHVYLDGKPQRVELTIPTWHAACLAASIPGERPLDDRALLGRLYYNLGLQFEKRQDYSSAVRAMMCSHQLDPRHRASQANLLATLNNWSVHLAHEGAWKAAERVAQHGLALDPEYVPLQQTWQRILTAEAAGTHRPQGNNWRSPIRFDSRTTAD